MGRLAEGRRGRCVAQTRGWGRGLSGLSGPGKLGQFLPPRKDSADLITIPEAIFPPTVWASPSLPLSVARLWGKMPAWLRSCSGRPAVSPWTVFPSLRLSFPIFHLCNGIDQPSPRTTGWETWGKQKALRRERLYFIAAVRPLSASDP